MSVRRYTHSIHEDALTVLFALPKAERRKVLNDCDEIVRNSFQEPDYERVDDDGRRMSHVLRGRFAIAYWVDHSARLVWITRIEIADL